jgi:cytochrome c553
MQAARESCARLLVLAATALASAGAVAQGASVEAGRTKAAACAVCHGPAGISTTPDAPHLAGMPAIYFTAQLRAYRSGARRHEVMAVMARQLSDDDIQNLAAWYSAIKIEATPPP